MLVLTLTSIYAGWRRRFLYRRCLAAPSRALILRYHSVGDPSRVGAYLDPGLSLPAERFREHLAILRKRFLFALPHQIRALRERPADAPRAVVITFDDGYRDNHDEALPLLREAGACAAFYVTTGALTSGHGLWISELFRLVPALPAGPLGIPGFADLEASNEPARRTPLRRALTRRLAALTQSAREAALDALANRAAVPRGAGLAETFMTPAHLRALAAAGMTVGAHTRSHPHLDLLPAEHHAAEVSGSRRDLEEILGDTIDSFAYPNPGGGGEALPPARASVERAGFRTAMTSTPAPLNGSSDLLRLPRVGVYAGAQERQLFALLASLPEQAA